MSHLFLATVPIISQVLEYAWYLMTFADRAMVIRWTGGFECPGTGNRLSQKLVWHVAFKTHKPQPVRRVEHSLETHAFAMLVPYIYSPTLTMPCVSNSAPSPPTPSRTFPLSRRPLILTLHGPLRRRRIPSKITPRTPTLILKTPRHKLIPSPRLILLRSPTHLPPRLTLPPNPRIQHPIPHTANVFTAPSLCFI